MSDKIKYEIALLDDSNDFCEALSQLILLKLDVHCLCFSSIDELFKKREEVLATKVIFLDINLGDGRPNGIDAQRWLVNECYSGRMFFFSGHVLGSPLLKDINLTGVRLLSKPMPIDELMGVIKDALEKQGLQS